MLYGLKSHMLAPVPPTQNNLARIIGGKHLSDIVTVMKINSLCVEMVDEETKDKFEVDLRYLCAISC